MGERVTLPSSLETIAELLPDLDELDPEPEPEPDADGESVSSRISSRSLRLLDACPPWSSASSAIRLTVELEDECELKLGRWLSVRRSNEASREEGSDGRQMEIWFMLIMSSMTLPAIYTVSSSSAQWESGQMVLYCDEADQGIVKVARMRD
jgi:hypothetical protein